MLLGGVGGAEGRGSEDSHVDGHIYVGDELDRQTRDEGKATAYSVDYMTQVKSRVKTSLTQPYAPDVMSELLLPVTPA